MNQILNAIKNRRSIRKYKNKPLNKEQIEEVIQAGRLAPSARNMQNWHFTVVTNKNLIKQMSEYVVGKTIEDPKYHFVRERSKTLSDPIFYSAPVVIFITADADKWSAINCALAAENMMLYAHSIGVGSCFIGMARFIEGSNEIMQNLNLPEGHEIYATLIFGYADEKPDFKKRETDNVSWID